MGASRTPGVIGQEPGGLAIDDGTLCRHTSPRPGTTGQERVNAGGLSDEQQALLIDAFQFSLDIVGIVDPTPVSDTASAAISIGRRDWLGAGLSLIGVVPYLGDVAKTWKIPRYVQSLKKAIALAKSDVRFAAHLEPILARFLHALDAIPLNKFSAKMAEKVYRLRRLINAFLYRKLIERVLQKGLGAIPESGLVRENVETLVDYIVSHQRRYKVWGQGGSPPEIERALNIGGFKSSHDIEKAVMEAASGIDIHQPVSIARFDAGTLVAQYVDEWKALDDTAAIKKSLEELQRGGNWFVKRQGAVGPDELGLSAEGRRRLNFVISQPIEVLQSKAAAVGDSWTSHVRANLAGGVNTARGQNVVYARGGGTQYYVPQSRNVRFLEFDSRSVGAPPNK